MRAGVDIGVASAGRTPPPHARVEAAIEAFAAGEIIVVTDDDDRENEGDLIVAASLCTPEKMAFIVRHTSGIVCAPLTREIARKLRLDPMVANNDAPLSTAFTVSVDVRHGTTTGISAEDRTNTCRALANPNIGAADFVRPGHVFPLVARDGGVLVRTGHTEATVDLCRMAGLPEVGVICEMMNDDGTVMRGPQVAAFAATHNLKHVSIAEMIAYRQSREKLVERVSSFTVETENGPVQGFAYSTPFDPVHHLAFVVGKIGAGEDVPTRLHRADVVKDVFGGAPAIKAAMETFRNEGRGVLVYLRDGTVGVPFQQHQETESETRRLQTWREVGVGAQILRDLGVHSIKLLTRSTHKFAGLSGFGIEISDVDSR
ncbi:3,4-dihydroxy-2-butanone 4-phosphate synthase [Hyphomonadaceae bacterium UKL13-1]|nr:3,4-dihydroxy-2-butanone 4-phosphate synthase [Hyphomonadaceae bacterium UKL13-1]